MGELLIKPYEISVWEDELTQNGFIEHKLAVIGSNTMDGPNRVYDPIFNKKTNGEKTLSFSLKYKYFDPYSGNEEVVNPFAKWLINERKIKLKYDDEWYEFIIKDYSESSDGFTWTYTCTDAFVLELSKNGYNIEFSADLNNNQGTARELTTKTLQGTDWRLGDSDNLKQLISEPVYCGVLENPSLVQIINTDDNDIIHLNSNIQIYVFYSYIQNKNGQFVQFIIHDENKNYTIDDKNVITDTNYRIKNDLIVKDDGFYLDNTRIIQINEIETRYHVNRLAYGQLTTYDPVMERTVDRFKLGDIEVYRYKEDVYTTSNVVMNFVTNGDNFNALEDGSLQGWNPYTDIEDGYSINKLNLVTKPELGTNQKLVDINVLSQIEGFLEAKFNGPRIDRNNKIYNTIYNSGISDTASFIGSISADDKFVLRWRAGIGNLKDLQPFNGLRAIVAKYDQDTPTRYGYYYKHINPADILIEFNGEIKILNNYIEGGILEPVIDEDTGQPTDKYNYVVDGVAQVPSTKYIYKVYNQNTDTTQEYIWNGEQGNFVPYVEGSSDYLPYYYMIGTARKTIPTKELKEPEDNRKIGIFFYVTQALTQTVVVSNTVKRDEEDTQIEISETIDPLYNTTITFKWNNSTISCSSKQDYSLQTGSYSFKYDATYHTIDFTVSTTATSISYSVTYTAIKPVYLQEVQLTRYIADANNQPVLIGNIPTATVESKDYYYIKPNIGDDKELIETYLTPQKLKESIQSTDELTPLYNEQSEKVLSISAAQSNCFNVLQTIAETFECWIDLVVEHEANGAITIDENGNARKFVYLREYVGKDNSAGFKYAVNLESIERNINSDEIVTKLIVDQSQSDYVDEGYVSIANAPSNPSGEAYLLNFDYYYSQGLLDRDTTNAELENFTIQFKELNKQLAEKNELYRKLSNSYTNIESKRNVYAELIESAQNAKSQALADFVYLTHMNYEDYLKEHNSIIDGSYEFNREKVIDWQTDWSGEGDYEYTWDDIFGHWRIYTLNGTEISIVPPNSTTTQNIKITNFTHSRYPNLTPIQYSNGVIYAKASSQSVLGTITYTFKVIEDAEQYAQLTEEDNVLDIIGQLYATSATINNYAGILNNIEKEYQEVKKQLYGYQNYKLKVWTATDILNKRHIYIELNDYLPDLSFTINNSEPYNTNVNVKYFDIISNGTIINFNAPAGYTINQQQYIIDDNKVAKFHIINNETVSGIEDEIEDIQDQKNELTKQLNNKYRRFIQEGTWNSTEYIDSELYYLDALQVSNISAFPVVSYTINVVEISQLEGYKDYLFDAGDKTYIEDTEFFGWSNKHGILTPAREEVIVSEVEWHLDDPSQNTVTIQNYKTRFEDLFQRINAAVQTVQYNEATYAKISSLMDANGTINQDVLISSLNKISGQTYNLTSDGSIIINGENILIRNLTEPANRVIISNEGIRISSDGGDTWRTVVSGRGIDAGAVYTGKLRTDLVIIGSENNPSFRWDQSGISAYKSDGYITDDEGKEIPAYDLRTYVRFDEYGLYGIKGNDKYKASSLEDIKDSAHFGVTWDGFFIKNSYPGGGRVEITSDNDFRVMNIPEGQTTEQEKIKIGALEWGKDGNDNPILSPDAPGATEAPTLYGIRIKNNDGDVVMQTGDDGNLEITGTIIANAGQIGGMSVDNTRLRMDHIVFEPGTGIYSDWGESSVYPFIISDKDGSAIFNSVVVRGSIKTSVFEYEEIQAVGGAFMFRPSTAIKTAVEDDGDLILTVEKPLILRDGAWYKLSNYNSDDTIDADELTTYGLTHIYQLNKTKVDDQTEIRLIGGAAILQTINIDDIPGGSIIDMGFEPNTYRPIKLIEESSPVALHLYELVDGEYVLTNDITVVSDKTYYKEWYQAGINNYGIGINSSDNYINLPPRAISLFETIVNHTQDPKVSYKYRGILGTLPQMRYSGNNPQVNELYHNYLEGTQGIYTDNMYLGDKEQYIAFYEDSNGNKQLKIKANQVMYEIVDEETGESEWKDVQDTSQGLDGEDAITVSIDSSAGNVFLNKHIQTTLTCTVTKGSGTDITDQVTRFTWIKKNADGTIDSSWSRPLAGRSITLTDTDVNSKAIFVCEVEF